MRLKCFVTFATIAALGLGTSLPAAAQAPSSDGASPQKGSTMAKHAKGTFEVKVIPQGTPDVAEGIALGRMSIDKQLSGDLQGTTKGEMLTAMVDANGAGAYVAVERVTAKLDGRSGSFAFMHNGVMSKDGQHLTVTVVPSSGTGELAGISGTMAIIIEGKQHSYDFEYTLPTAP